MVLIASAAAYKGLVSCIDQSKFILEPTARRNVAVLIGYCTNNYQSPYLQEHADFHFKIKENIGQLSVFAHGNDKAGKESVKKRQNKLRKLHYFRRRKKNLK